MEIKNLSALAEAEEITNAKAVGTVGHAKNAKQCRSEEEDTHEETT